MACVQEAEKSEGYPPSNTASLRARKMEGYNKEGLARAEAPTASQMEDKTVGAMQSAGDVATRTKCAAVIWSCGKWLSVVCMLQCAEECVTCQVTTLLCFFSAMHRRT